ncbi:MAG: hypothetical protein AAF990_02905 [Bacteroidota bacterium]
MAAKKRAKTKKKSTPSQEPIDKQVDQASVPDKATSKGFWSKHWIPGLIIALLAFGLYSLSINFEYVLDDQIVFTNNSYVKKGFGGIKEIMTTESFSGYFGGQRDLVVGGRYRPLSIATFAVEYALFKENPKVSHFINILLYALTGLLVFRLFHTMWPTAKPKVNWYIGLPFVAALLFICHPVHSEVVANVKGRDEIMCLMGALAALYYAFRYHRSGQWLWLFAMAITFFLALLAKESALTFVAVIPLSLYFFRKPDWGKTGIATAVLLICSLAYISLRTSVIGYLLDSGTEMNDIMNNPFAGMSAAERFATVFYTLGLYIKLLFIPHPLTHDYYPYHIPIMNWSEWQSILSLVINLGVGVLGLIGLKKKRLWSYGILFYFLTLSIVSNVPFTVGTFMNERFIYMPSIGFCLIAGWFIGHQLPKWTQGEGETSNLLSIGLAALLVIGFATKTLMRVPAWKNALSLNEAAIKVSKNSARANLFMGTALFKEYLAENAPAQKQALLEQVDAYVRKAMEVNPRYGSAIKMYSGVVAEQYKADGNLDKLLSQFKNLILTKPNIDYIDTYLEFLIDKGTDNDKLANWCYEVGSRFAASGSNFTGNALKYLEKYGMQLAPGDPRIRQELVKIYQALGNSNKVQQYQ